MKTFVPKVITVFPKKAAAPKKEGQASKGKPRRPHLQMIDAKGEALNREWHVVDAKGLVLGRMATQIANVLRGKHKPTFTPNMDMGDFVIVLNAGEIKLTGNKLVDKFYHRHSGYPGGMRADNYEDMRTKWPDLMVWQAVKRMLPRNKLRAHYMRKLKVYKGAEHPHVAQQPKPLDLNKVTG